jgi:hypothetical protein
MSGVGGLSAPITVSEEGRDANGGVAKDKGGLGEAKLVYELVYGVIPAC